MNLLLNLLLYFEKNSSFALITCVTLYFFSFLLALRRYVPHRANKSRESIDIYMQQMQGIYEVPREC